MPHEELSDRQLLMLILSRLDELEKLLSISREKESYTIDELAERVGRTAWAVRKWCRLGQIKAKKVFGKGRTGEWRISNEELVRIQNDGPGPEPKPQLPKGEIYVSR